MSLKQFINFSHNHRYFVFPASIPHPFLFHLGPHESQARILPLNCTSSPVFILTQGPGIVPELTLQLRTALESAISLPQLPTQLRAHTCTTFSVKAFITGRVDFKMSNWKKSQGFSTRFVNSIYYFKGTWLATVNLIVFTVSGACLEHLCDHRSQGTQCFLSYTGVREVRYMGTLNKNWLL